MVSNQTFTTEDFVKNYGLVTSADVKQDYKNLNYLAWAKAWRLMIEQDPEATYEVQEKTIVKEDGRTETTFNWEGMVRTKVTFKGKTLPMHLAIMNNRHEAVKEENLNGTFISNSLMRCLTKNIALFGIGLNVYEGEDIPDDSEAPSQITEKNKERKKKANVKEDLTQLCKDLIAKGINKDSINNILKKYEEKGLIAKMTAANAKKALEEIQKLKGE